MIGLLEQAAFEAPDQVAVATPGADHRYEDLLRRARHIAGNLSDRGITRFGVLHPDAAANLAVLAGAALAGAEPCIYPQASTDEAAADLAARFDHEVVVTDRDLGVLGLPLDELTAETTAHEALTAPEDARLMVMTTGTSGHPRGVRHEWRRVLRAAERIKPAPEQNWLLAYGLNQFGGLQILIHVLAARATLVAAESFQPRSALRAMRDKAVTHASGTPTFWRFVLSEIQGDGGAVPPLAQVTLGGEAVPAALLDRIRSVFPKANVSQIYGATEFGQNVTVRDGRPGLPISFLESGRDVEFKVVDGELWVRSRASMLGYYKEVPVDAEQWRPTGDLVEVVGDRIEFRGRKTDVINVGGVKVHPLPVEDRISAVPGVALARAFGRPNALTGSILAVEVVAEPGADEDAVATAIRAACADFPPAMRPRSIRFVETMDTTGNKMSRGARA